MHYLLPKADDFPGLKMEAGFKASGSQTLQPRHEGRLGFLVVWFGFFLKARCCVILKAISKHR